MPTLGSLIEKFASAAGENGSSTAINESPSAAPDSGETKTASGGGNNMTSLADIFMHLTDMDKTASEAAGAPQDNVDFAKVAEQLAEAEASTVVEEDQDMIKVAAEYDAAGRIIARGFFDEFMKLAASVTTEASNQNTETETAAKTPALGERGLPTVETNYAGSPNHDQPIDTKTGRDAYKDSLAPAKKIDAGVTGTDPEAAAISIGQGSPAGFATVRDLMG
jgi:hypothetical protein